ncbi:MAG: hypothetical protein Salg2KO_00770 [Salibacteraceae bacterium]
MPKTVKDYVFVGAQLLLFVLFTFQNNPWIISFPRAVRHAGIVASLIGVVMVFWAIIQLRPSLSIFPTPIPGGKLITSGIYARFRHPIYSGLIIAMLGYAITSQSGFRLGIVVALFLLFWLKARYEESRLSQTFDGYEQYKKTSWMFFPGF